MNKLSKIFLVIIVILAIALAIMTYYFVYWRDAYLSSANQMVEMVQRLEVQSDKDNRNMENVNIEVVKDLVTPSGATIIITDKNEKQYAWGESYKIQVKENEKWKYIEPITGVFFNEIGYILDENGQIEQKIDWSKFYGILSNGTYRIEKYIYSIREEVFFYSDEFQIN